MAGHEPRGRADWRWSRLEPVRWVQLSLTTSSRDGGSVIGASASAVAESRADEVRDGGSVCERRVRTHGRGSRDEARPDEDATSDERPRTRKRASKKKRNARRHFLWKSFRVKQFGVTLVG